jgi:hypothetical protein
MLYKILSVIFIGSSFLYSLKIKLIVLKRFIGFSLISAFKALCCLDEMIALT